MTESKTKTASHPRPLSPHLSIYHWHLSMALSILHRATGVALSVGIVFFVAWLWSVAYCPDAVSFFHDAASAWWGKLFLFGWTLAFFIHFGNGIRHLFWDAGKGFALGTALTSGRLVILSAIVFTAAVWLPLLAQ